MFWRGGLETADLLLAQIGTAFFRAVHNKNCYQGGDVHEEKYFHAHRIS